MADYLNIGQISSSGDSMTDQMVAAYKNTQKYKVSNIEQQKSELEKRQTFYNKMNSKLNSLISKMDKFGDYKKTTIDDSGEEVYTYSKLDKIDSEFAAKRINSSNSEFISATASSEASLVNLSARVNRLASSDILLSDSLNLEDNFAGSTGTKQFQMTVNGNTSTIEIDVTDEDTNESVMNKIANTINANEEIGIRASLIMDTTSTGRLSFTSNETGGDNRILFNDSDLLGNIGLFTNKLNSNKDSRSVATDSKAGYQVANYSNLNSEVLIDGVTVERNSNSISDALNGITLNLKKVMEDDVADVKLTGQVDTDSVEKLIKPLLSSYNDILMTLTNEKDIRRTEPAARSLFYRLRDIPNKGIETESSDQLRFIYDLGITANENGTLSITDKEKLQTALEENSQRVSDVFNADNGFVKLINEAVSYLKGDDGVLMQRKSSLVDQIERKNDRIKTVEDSINQQAEMLRKEYTDYLESYYQAQGQYNLLSTMSAGGNYGGGYTDLLLQSYQ